MDTNQNFAELTEKEESELEGKYLTFLDRRPAVCDSHCECHADCSNAGDYRDSRISHVCKRRD